MPKILPPAELETSSNWPSVRKDGCAVAVGNFDGVHIGHAAIIAQLLKVSDAFGLPSAAYTFDPHPSAIVRPNASPPPLTTSARRAYLLRLLGVDAVLVQPTDQNLVSLEANTFFENVLIGSVNARALVEGRDFRFGRGRSGDVALLGALCQRHGMSLEVIDPLLVDGQAVSSSRIRALVAAGNFVVANKLLTSPYRLTGHIVQGAQIGRTLGFPTANMKKVTTLIPAFGVYAAMACTERGQWPAAVHIGPNVSFGQSDLSIEVHLIGFSGDLYGTILDVDFLEKLRETQKFSSPALLSSQLSEDVKAALHSVLSRKKQTPEANPFF